MIKIIRDVLIKSFDNATDEWDRLEIIPATAKLTTETIKNETGFVKTYNLTATIRHVKPVLYDNVKVMVLYDKGCASFGTIDLPVNFEVQQDNIIAITAKYSTSLSPL